MRKYVALLLIFTILLFSLTGCYDVRPIETLSYAVAIGLDKGTNNLLRLSLQFASPASGSSSSRWFKFTVFRNYCNYC